MLSQMPRFFVLMNVVSQAQFQLRYCCLRRWACARDRLQIMFSRWGVAASLVGVCGRLPGTQGRLPFVMLLSLPTLKNLLVFRWVSLLLHSLLHSAESFAAATVCFPGFKIK